MSVIPTKAVRRSLARDPGLIVDLFAGGGGASIGIEAAMGRHVDVAINHDPIAIAVHMANHPHTVHYTTDIWEVSPRKATCGRRVKLLHASPDCKHFSRAKGGKPKSGKIRSLAWVVRRWARDVQPECITMENVEEFLDWGPLFPALTWRNAKTGEVRTFATDRAVIAFEAGLSKGGPRGWADVSFTVIPGRKGETFRRWKRDLERLGYVVEYRVLKACDYGAPTSRKRLFIVARRDGKPITWPKPTHGKTPLLPFHTAAECIDFGIDCSSIFPCTCEAPTRSSAGRATSCGACGGRLKPLADKTMRRIAAGIIKFVQEEANPFVIQVDHTLVAPTLIQTGYGEREGQAPRSLDLHKPLGTLMAQGQKHGLVAAFIAQHNLGQVGHTSEKPLPTITAIDSHALVTSHLATFRGTAPGQPMAASVEKPLGTISAGGIHAGEVRTFLTTYYGSPLDVGQSVNDPMRTVVTKDRFGLVTIAGVDYEITDIGMRMLEPHELLRAQFGRFAQGTDMTPAKTKKDKVRLIGNSVCPELEEAIVAAQFPEEAARARARAA